MFLNNKDYTISECIKDEINYTDPTILCVWRIYIPDFNFEKAEFFLSPEEKKRMGKYKFEKDRKTYAAGRSALRLILSRFLKEKPRDLKFTYNNYGKPKIETHSETKICFNISHSGEFALIAVGFDAEIGIDIEFAGELDYLALAESVFSEQELAELKTVPVKYLKTSFYKLWTRKEAFIKAVGMGLSFSLKEFDVSLISNITPQITIHKSQSSFDTGWEVCEIFVSEQYCASLVFPANRFTKIRVLDFNFKLFE
jgi:4'-phosphopantetheinyl transferase